MTEQQYTKALEKLGLTPMTAGPVLGIGWRQSCRYASGESKVPEPVARLLWFMQRHGVSSGGMIE